jgi:hypothetical protein
MLRIEISKFKIQNSRKRRGGGISKSIDEEVEPRRARRSQSEEKEGGVR